MLDILATTVAAHLARASFTVTDSRVEGVHVAPCGGYVEVRFAWDSGSRNMREAASAAEALDRAGFQVTVLDDMELAVRV